MVFLVAKSASDIASTFPQVNCANIEKDYGTQLEQYAAADYAYIKADPGKKSSGTL